MRNLNNYLDLYWIILIALIYIIWVDRSSAPKQKQKLRETFGNRYRTIRDACADPKIQEMDKVQVPHFRFIFDRQSKEVIINLKAEFLSYVTEVKMSIIGFFYIFYKQI